MERHVDARHQDERPPTADEFTAALHLGLQLLQTAHRAGDRVLRAAQVEVHDLQEFAGALRDLVDEPRNVGVVEIDLRRPDRRQPVVGAAQLVARHDVMHVGAALKHRLQQRFQLVDAAHAGQRGVFADRVAAGDRVLDEGALLAHLGDLGGRHRRHGDLGELGQVQHALGVLVVHAAGDEAGRVVAHHVQDREAQRFAGVLVGVVPHFAGGLRAGPDLHAHALVLNALTGKRVDGLGRGQPCRRRHHQVGSDARRDFQNLCALVDSDPIDPEVHLVAGTHHTQEAGRPADQSSRRTGLAVGRGHHMLRRCRQPHSVHDRRFQTGQQCGGPIGVNRVVIAGHHRERAHVDRCGQRDVPTAAPRGVGGVLGYRATGPQRVGQFGSAGAATNCEPLLKGGKHRAVGCGDRHRDRDHAADFGIGGHRSRCGNGQFGRHLGQGAMQVRGMVQVHQAQQALHDRDTGGGDRGADGREDRGPAAPDQRVGHGGQGGCQRLAEDGGDAGVVGHLLGVPRHGHSGCPVVHPRQRVRTVGAGGDGQHRAHGFDGVLGADNRNAAVNRAGGQAESDIDPGARDRHAQHHLVTVGL